MDLYLKQLLKVLVLYVFISSVKFGEIVCSVRSGLLDHCLHYEETE